MSSGPELSRAMWKLINQCVRDEGGQGGVASNIGEHKTLGIILRSYNPSRVQCSRQADQHYGIDHCHVLLDHVPAEVAPLKTWGRLGDTGVDVGLPTMEAAAAPISTKNSPGKLPLPRPRLRHRPHRAGPDDPLRRLAGRRRVKGYVREVQQTWRFCADGYV
ncbi:MAG: hypothetical protein L6R37_002985 [Teloschistes peruensis]|nr:MAG: hypothetical protein L6R37_002985 [Teloschistes peruensis]